MPFAEEKAIMVFYKQGKDSDLLTTILTQHEQIRDYLTKIDSDKSIAKKLDKLMREHLKLEDTKFYPMLDSKLTPEEQDEMFKEFLFLFNQKASF